jgi:hypothetical protein
LEGAVAVYITNNKHIDAFFEFAEENRGILQNTSFHFVLEKTTQAYPHNILRNVAMQTIESDYFVALDVDFIPAPKNSYEGLVSLLQSNHTVRDELRENRRLFIIPAFELFARDGQTEATEDMLPHSKEDIAEMVKNQAMQPFEKGFARGHLATNHPKWLELVKGQKGISYYTLDRTQKRRLKYFEPFVLGYRPGIPRYWEDLRGFGWDKISFFQECIAAGYVYAVLCDFYCVHLNHPDPSRESQSAMERLNEPYVIQFKNYKEKMYPKKGITKL